VGFLIDDAGDDVYGGDIVGLGFAWDIGVAGIMDFGGNDHYLMSDGARGNEASLGFLFDHGGDDTYGGRSFGTTAAKASYHPMPDCGGNFSFSINISGKDNYGVESLNDVDQESGWAGGFFIDREMALPAKK